MYPITSQVLFTMNKQQNHKTRRHTISSTSAAWKRSAVGLTSLLILGSVESFSVLPSSSPSSSIGPLAQASPQNTEVVQDDTIVAASPSIDNDATATSNETTKLSLEEAKTELLELLPRMTGQAHEFKRVEFLINNLEELYQPIETLDFLNLLQQGEWQLLFSTNLAQRPPSPQVFRMRELYQKITCQQMEGSLDTIITWDVAEAMPGNFDATGTFTVKNTYEITQGARFEPTLQEHVLQPKGRIPDNVPGLVTLLRRAMPAELFDASQHFCDTTYLDHDLKLVRYTGPQYEGQRNVWIRRGALSIDPTASSSTKSATNEVEEKGSPTDASSADLVDEMDDLFLED